MRSKVVQEDKGRLNRRFSLFLCLDLPSYDFGQVKLLELISGY